MSSMLFHSSSILRQFGVCRSFFLNRDMCQNEHERDELMRRNQELLGSSKNPFGGHQRQLRIEPQSALVSFSILSSTPFLPSGEV